jgi:hypothetical protein
MSLKSSLGRLIRMPAELAPRLVDVADQSVEDVRDRLAWLNSVLAERALPEDRRTRVSELSLQQKAAQAGQRPQPEESPENNRKSSIS